MSNVCYELRDGGGTALTYASTYEAAKDKALKLVWAHRQVKIIRLEEVEEVTVKDRWMLSVTQP